MLLTLTVGGGLLGVLLGGTARASFGWRSWRDSKKLGLLIAILPVAGVIGLFLPIPHYGRRLPLCVYLVSLLTGYIVTAMLEAGPGGGEQPHRPAALPPIRELTPAPTVRR